MANMKDAFGGLSYSSSIYNLLWIVDINAAYQGKTLLEEAAGCGRYDPVQYLLRRGATNITGALYEAMRNNHLRIVDLLRQRGGALPPRHSVSGDRQFLGTLQMYWMGVDRAQKAALTVLMVRRTATLNHDVLRMIAWLVWESRKEPNLWIKRRYKRLKRR